MSAVAHARPEGTLDARDADQLRADHGPRCVFATEYGIAGPIERAAAGDDSKHVVVSRIHHLDRGRVVRVHRFVHYDLIDDLSAAIVDEPDLVARTESAQAIEDRCPVPRHVTGEHGVSAGARPRG